MRISKSLLEAVKEHGRRTYPEECCGILLGQSNGGEKVIAEAVAMNNIAEHDREHRYLIPPEVYLKVDREARQRRLEVVGFYHSHPDHPAVPSQFDLDHAWAWFSYLVTRIEKGEPKETTAWVLRDDRSAFEAEPLEVVE